MPARQPLPRLWLMTDERQGDALWTALARLPRGAGVVFRHYSLAHAERRRLFAAVRAAARRRGLVLLLAGRVRDAIAWRADGVHSRGPHRAPRDLLRTAPAHDAMESIAAWRAGADAIFLSPAFPTRSHPGARALGPLRFALLSRHARTPVLALGGMTKQRARRLAGVRIHGWGAIDAWGSELFSSARAPAPAPRGTTPGTRA